MSTLDPDEVVRLATAPNPVVAHVWADALQAEGIRARVLGDYLEASLGDLSGTLPEIWVRRGDVPRAEEVLRRELEGVPEGADDSGAEDEEAGT
jgi:hypothetical protein